MKTIQPLKERLIKIVEDSYQILCNKIASNSILVPNEASLQLHFGVILKQIGQLYEFGEKDRFLIKLEDVQMIDRTQKSKKGKARCDIMLSLSNDTDDYSVAIELKCFKKTGSETITDNRFNVLKDIENLEHYKDVNSKLCCYQIVYTDNPNYSNPNSTSYIKIGDGAILNNGVHTSNGNNVVLKNSYTFNWDIYADNHCFLKIKV